MPQRLERHLEWSYEEWLKQGWILGRRRDGQPLYGSQQGGQLGYHPAKPGRPSHAYHAYMAGS